VPVFVLIGINDKVKGQHNLMAVQCQAKAKFLDCSELKVAILFRDLYEICPDWPEPLNNG
jgi:hypothetical protein